MKLHTSIHIFGPSNLTDEEATTLMQIQKLFGIAFDSACRDKDDYISWWYRPEWDDEVRAMTSAYYFAYNAEILLPDHTVIFEVLRG